MGLLLLFAIVNSTLYILVSDRCGRSSELRTVDDDTEGSGDFKAWEAKFRCTNLRSAKKHSVGQFIIDNVIFIATVDVSFSGVSFEAKHFHLKGH